MLLPSRRLSRCVTVRAGCAPLVLGRSAPPALLRGGAPRAAFASSRTEAGGATSSAPPLHAVARALATRRKLPPSLNVADTASTRISALLEAQTNAIGVRLGMVNDWGSHTGFSYTLVFVGEDAVEASDERIDLPNGSSLYVERKALWVGEGGLVGATLDLDEDFNLIITPKDKG